MTYRKYAYVFPCVVVQDRERGISAKLEWSFENCASLPERASTERDKNLILDFMDANKVGSFIKLSTGEMVFQTS